MTKICHAILLDENGEKIGPLDGIVFSMGGFIAIDNKGRVFYGKIKPITNELINISLLHDQKLNIKIW